MAHAPGLVKCRGDPKPPRRSHFHLSRPQVCKYSLIFTSGVPNILEPQNLQTVPSWVKKKSFVSVWIFGLFSYFVRPHVCKCSLIFASDLSYVPNILVSKIGQSVPSWVSKKSSVPEWIFWLFSSGLNVDLLFWYGKRKECKKLFQKC